MYPFWLFSHNLNTFETWPWNCKHTSDPLLPAAAFPVHSNGGKNSDKRKTEDGPNPQYKPYFSRSPLPSCTVCPFSLGLLTKSNQVLSLLQGSLNYWKIHTPHTFTQNSAFLNVISPHSSHSHSIMYIRSCFNSLAPNFPRLLSWTK